MSLIDDIKTIDVNDALGVLARALDIIGDLAKSANGSNAADIVMAIKHIYDAVLRVSQKKTTPEEIYAELEKFLVGIENNDAAVSAALDDKFPSR